MNINKKRKLKPRKLALWLILFLAILVLFDITIFEPGHPKLVTYHVAIPNLPKDMDGFRVVQLSDLHKGPVVPDDLIRRAVNAANSTSADVALLTGDFVSKNAANAEPCAKVLSGLHTKYGSYAVLGNHDYWHSAGIVRQSLTKYKIKLLTNTNTRIRSLYIVGLDDKWAGKPNVHRAFSGVGAKSPYIMVSHSPLIIDLLKNRRSLLITGHTHGGQVLIPFIPRSKLPGLRGWKYIAGWYKPGGVLMYVNRGIGMVNPPVRFRCRPEVTLYILHPATGSNPAVLKQYHPHI